MKAVVYRDVERVDVAEVADLAAPSGDEAIVRVTTTAVCGSDLHFYRGEAPIEDADGLGHEAVGVVEDLGPDVTALQPGQRVVVAFGPACGRCWYCARGMTSHCVDFAIFGSGRFARGLGGAQAERLRVPHADTTLLPVPDDVEDERAVFVGDVMTTGLYGADVAGVSGGDVVAVVGAGPVGYFAIRGAQLRGAATVLGVDLSPERLALVAALGATPVDAAGDARAAVLEATDGRGADAVIEAVGSVTAFQSAVRMARPGGRVGVLGMYTNERTEIHLGVYWSRAVDVRFAGMCPIHARWRDALDLVRTGAVDPRPLVSHRLPLEDASKGYELFAAREATKVLLEP